MSLVSNITLEEINNGFILYHQTYKVGSWGSSSNPVMEMIPSGTARKYFPTLNLAINELVKLFDHEMPEGLVIKPRDAK